MNEEDYHREPCHECGDGDKVPAIGYWRCPACDAEWHDDEDGECVPTSSPEPANVPRP